MTGRVALLALVFSVASLATIGCSSTEPGSKAALIVPATSGPAWFSLWRRWFILWPLILGFGLSGVVQAVVSKGEMSKLLAG
jgi:hypothetical protein